MKLNPLVIAATATLLAVVAVRATAGSVTSFPPPPPSPGAEVVGTVRLPNGSLAGLNRSMLEQFTALLVQEAEALTATNIHNVGRNVGVQLSLRRSDGAVQALETSFTNDQGQFLMYLPSGTSEDTCRFILSVGSAQTLTRAFVYSTTEPITVDYASETAVALILGHVQQGADFCGFSAAEIRSLVNCIRNLPGNVTGANVFETNRNALLLTGSAIGQSGGQCLDGATPVATVTPTPTRTPTAPVCIGDCNGDGAVTVNELITGINIALGTAPVGACPALQCPSAGPPGIVIDCFIIAVGNLLHGCPTTLPTPTPRPVNPVPGPYEASGLILGPGGPESEFLVGTLDISPPQGARIPNTIFMYAVENSRWHSRSFEIVQTGDPGGISARTFHLGVVAMGLTVRINGEVVQLFGSGEYFVAADFRLILFKLNLTGGDYAVTLTVIPGETRRQQGEP